LVSLGISTPSIFTPMWARSVSVLGGSGTGNVQEPAMVTSVRSTAMNSAALVTG